MQQDVQRFRQTYRRQIAHTYRAWRHGACVAALGLGLMALFLASANDIHALEYSAVVLTLLALNMGEYWVHKNLGHFKRRFGRLFYKRHTGDHHSFFSHTQMRYEQMRDFRVILFPVWLVLVQGAGAGVLYLALCWLNSNIASLVAATWVGGYLLYELFHALEHLPDRHLLSRLPWVAQMRTLHALHHRRDLMHSHNFNIVFPLSDWLFGTLYWETKQPEDAATTKRV